MLFKFELKTTVNSLYNINTMITEEIQKNDIKNGICVIFCPHTTAAISVNENTDPDAIHDFMLGLSIAVPNRNEFLHMEGVSDAHIKSSLVGTSQTMIVQDGTLLLGTWQSVFLCEFDAPKNRTFFARIIVDSNHIYEDNSIDLKNGNI